MGRIFFNEKTGEFWESTLRRRKPPEGFKYTGYNARYGIHPRNHMRKSFFCPKCKVYHYYINLWETSETIPLHVKKKIEFTGKYGCEEAEKLVDIAFKIGGRKRHYEIVEILKAKGRLEKWEEKLVQLKANLRRIVIEKLLNGESDEEIEVSLIAEAIKT